MKKSPNIREYVALVSAFLLLFLAAEAGVLWLTWDAWRSKDFVSLSIGLLFCLLFVYIAFSRLEVHRIVAFWAERAKGPREKFVYFQRVCEEEKDEKMSERHFYKWYVLDGKGQAIILLLPRLQTYEEALKNCPEKDKEIRILYYEASGILCAWGAVSQYRKNLKKSKKRQDRRP